MSGVATFRACFAGCMVVAPCCRPPVSCLRGCKLRVAVFRQQFGGGHCGVSLCCCTDCFCAHCCSSEVPYLYHVAADYFQLFRISFGALCFKQFFFCFGFGGSERVARGTFRPRKVSEFVKAALTARARGRGGSLRGCEYVAACSGGVVVKVFVSVCGHSACGRQAVTSFRLPTSQFVVFLSLRFLGLLGLFWPVLFRLDVSGGWHRTIRFCFRDT